MRNPLAGRRRGAPSDADLLAHMRAERQRIIGRSRVRQFVFGSLDGLLVPLGVVSGVAGGTGNLHAVIIAGLAEAFAGALSMGAGEFLSGRSEAEVQRYEVERESREIDAQPDEERREIALLFQREGLSPEGAQTVARLITSRRESWLRTMAEKELGLQVDGDGDARTDALAMSISYLVASAVPLLPYFLLPIRTAFVVSLLATIVALVIIGVVKSQLTHLRLIRSAAEVVVVGVLSGLGGFLLGTVLPHLLGS